MTEPDNPEPALDPADEAAIDAILDCDGPADDTGLPHDPNLRVLAAIAALQRTPLFQEERETTRAIAPIVVDGLTMIEPIGSGGFGTVFRAHDNQLHRDVALKVLTLDSDTDTVLREGRLLARLRHPNVVTVYGVKPFAAGIALEMEFVDGETLAEIIRRDGPLSVPEAIRIGIGLCDALGAVHAAGLLHRDVKAQNVMRERHTSRVVLMDFGAGLMGDGKRRSAELAGTPLYAAPEVWQAGAATQRSDVYSVGVLIYFLLTGSFPVMADTIDALKAQHQAGARRPIRELSPWMPVALASVIQQATAADPAARFPTAAALAIALHGLEKGVKQRHRVRWRKTLTAAIFVVAATGGFLANRVHSTKSARNPIFVRVPAEDLGRPSTDGRTWPFVTEAGSLRIFDASTGRTREALAYHEHEMPRSSIVSPNGDRVAYTVKLGDGAYRVETATVDGTWTRVIMAAEAAYEPELVSWSQDEALLLCWLHQRTGRLDLAIMPTNGEPPRVLLNTSSREDPGGSLSPDGAFAVVERWRDPETRSTDLLALPTNGSPPAVIYRDDRHPHAPLWAPDGEHVLFLLDSVSVPGAQDLYVVTVRNGQRLGAATLLASNVGTGPQITYGITAQSELVSRVSRNTSEVYLYSLNLQSAAPADAPRRVSMNAIDRHTGASYSPDGCWIAYFDLDDPPSIGANARPVLVILNRDTHASRRLSVPLAVLGYAEPRWTHDSAAVSVFGREAGSERYGYYRVEVSTGATTPIVVLKNWVGTHIGQWGRDDGQFIYPDHTRGVIERDLATGAETILLAPNRWHGSDFAVAPDGSIAFVAYASNPRSIEVRRPDGLVQTVLTADAGRGLRVHTWSSDGRYIFFTSPRGEAASTIYRVSSDGGPAVDTEIRWVPSPNPASISPDGKEMAVTESSVEHELRFLPLRFPE